MTDIVVAFDPTAIKLKHMRRMEKHFGIRFGSLVKRLEQLKDFDISALTADELAAMVYMMKCIQGEDIDPAVIDDLSFEELGRMAAQTGTPVVAEDPTSGV